MRRFAVLVRSAALEALAEPLSAILFLVALVAVHVLPSFHFHQFGEPGRLPRECGFSALLVFGLAFATSAAVHAVGRELESGTAAMALSRPVPRPLFFCAKIAGVFAALALFGVAVACATVLSVVSPRSGESVGSRLSHHGWQQACLAFLRQVPAHYLCEQEKEGRRGGTYGRTPPPAGRGQLG